MRFRWTRWLFLPLPAVLALAGCKPSASAPQERVPPNPSAPARYGPPTGVASKEIPRALPPARDTNWQSAPFAVLHTELSPAILVHSSTRYLGLFADLAEQGLGAPAHVAWSTKDGPRAFPAGETHDARGLEENWLLVWFAGATNWTNWDSPWAVFLQHKPKWLRLDERGLHLEFPARAGDVVVMPLYGYFKLPPAGRDYQAEHGMKSRELRSWTWEKALARDPLTRLRFWAGASREFPIYCEETFSVDRARDELTIRSRIHWHSIDDDWKTKHVKLAPVSPALALAARDKDFPARFSQPFHDMEMPTPFGPYAGVQGVDSFDVTFPWLHYINETEAFQPPDTNAHPVVGKAWWMLREMARTNVLSDAGSAWARALPYLYDDSTDDRSGLTGRFKEWITRSAAPSSVLHNETRVWPSFADLFQSAWAYAHFAKDWETIRREWPRWRETPPEINGADWASFSPRAGFYQAETASRFATLARLAYRMEDMDLYHNACLQFTKTATGIWTSQRRTEYFQKQQPWDSMEWMSRGIGGTNLVSAFDGCEDLFEVNDPDVARFHRDWLRDDVRRRLDWPAHWWNAQIVSGADSWKARLFVAARVGLLGESISEITGRGTPVEWVASGDPGYLTTLLRSSRPHRYERLIPPGEPSPFVAGAERAARGERLTMLTELSSASAGGEQSGAWPRLEWPRWKTPGGGPWSFGRIKPVRDGQPASVRRQALNWNTEVVTYALP